MIGVQEASLTEQASSVEFIALPLHELDKRRLKELEALGSVSPTAHPLQTAAFVRFAHAARPQPFAILAEDGRGLVGCWLGSFESERNRPGWLFKAVLRSGPVLRPALEPGAKDVLVREFIYRAEEYGVSQGATRIVVTSETVYGAGLGHVMAELGYRPDAAEWATYVFDLERPIEDIWQGLDPKARRSVMASERRGVSVSVTQDLSDIRAFRSMLDSTLRAGGMPIPLAKDFAESCLQMISEGHAYVIVAKHDGQVVGGKLEVTGGDLVLSFHTSAAKGSLRCGDLLAWKEIEFAKERGFRSLDLLSIALGAESGPKQEGIRRFKAKWGGDQIATPVYTRRLPVHGLRGTVVKLARLAGRR